MPAGFLMTPPCPHADERDSSGRKEVTGIFREELIAERCRETDRAEMAQIVVEVTELRRSTIVRMPASRLAD